MMDNSIPIVSVIMPAYNSEKYIEKAVDSVLVQTLQDFELIIIDDCSTDETCNIVNALAEKDNRIQFIRNENNLGTAETRNKGFDLCKGRYIALLDSDDIWYPEKLEKQVVLAEAEKADIIYCSYAIVDEAGNKRCNDFIVPEQTDVKKMLIKSVISCSTALLSKNIVDKYRFPVDYYHEDYAMWLQLLHDGYKACGISEVLGEYRVQAVSRASNKLSSAKRRWIIYRSFLKMSTITSAYYLMRYAFAGIVKYRNIQN